MTPPNPPKHLSRAAKAHWRKVVASFDVTDVGLLVLQAGLEAWDRMVEARERLAQDGAVYVDRFGAPRKHPSVSIEEAARIAFLRAMKELDLDPSDPNNHPGGI